MSGEAIIELYIFLPSRVKLKPYSTKNHLYLLFIIYNHFSKEFKSCLSFQVLFHDNEHDSVLKANQIQMFLIQLNSCVTK